MYEKFKYRYNSKFQSERQRYGGVLIINANHLIKLNIFRLNLKWIYSLNLNHHILFKKFLQRYIKIIQTEPPSSFANVGKLIRSTDLSAFFTKYTYI